MSIFYCHPCGSYIDNDEAPGETDPRNDAEMICADCFMALEDEPKTMPVGWTPNAAQAAIMAEAMAGSDNEEE